MIYPNRNNAHYLKERIYIIMDSFISWIGGKKALRERIIQEFPKREVYNRYIEVFGGAGWVLFSEDKLAAMEVYNDINGDLVNLFRCVKYHPDAIQAELEYIFISREQFFDAREQISIRGMTDIQRAARFYIMIKESFGSDLRSFGVRPRDFKKATAYLNIVSDRLNNVVIENQDYQQIIKTYDRENALFYLDPPYYEAEGYYSNRFSLNDHIRLKESLDSINGKFLLSYNDCDYIRGLYDEYIIIEVDRLHNLSKDKVKPIYKELIIKNYK